VKNKVVIVSVLALLLVPLVAISSLAQSVKIGYIDSIKIFSDYKETQDAERQYRQDVDTWTAEKERMEQEIIRLRDELQAQSLMLSEEKKQEKKLDLDRKIQDYERFMKDTFEPGGLAEQRNRELTQPIIEKINGILEQIGKEQGYAMIFDVAKADVVYADKTLDLTELVLQRLNAQ